jgi:chaperonin GroEL
MVFCGVLSMSEMAVVEKVSQDEDEHAGHHHGHAH